MESAVKIYLFFDIILELKTMIEEIKKRTKIKRQLKRS